MFWTIFWIAAGMFSISMLLFFVYFIGFILFVALYGEQIRKIIINLPGYTPLWFTFVDFSKPTKPWKIIDVVFFVGRIMGAVFTKKISVVNEAFKSRLPKKIIIYLTCLRKMIVIAIVLLIASSAIFYLQEHGRIITDF